MAGGRELEPLYFEAGAASILGVASGYAGLVLSASPHIAAAAALSAAIGGFAVLLRLAAPAQLSLVGFTAVSLETDGELLLTLDQRIVPDELLLDRPLPLDELLLEDRLPSAADESRVVRLFDCSRLSDPGELQSRIERHLRSVSDPTLAEPSPPSDDSAALHQALAALKQSLR